MKEFEPLLLVWQTMSAGSVQCTLSQENEMLSVHITPKTATIDIKHPSALEFMSPFVRKNMERRMSTKEHIETKRSIVLGLLGSMKAKTDDITRNLSTVQEIANMLNTYEKNVVLKEKGKELAKIGHGADSLRLRLLSLEHMEVHDLTALKRLMDKLRSDPGGNKK
jgi:hypothetical protein